MPARKTPVPEGRGMTFLRSLVGHDGDECVIWPMFRDPTTGYGRIGVRGKPTSNRVGYAHRVMCELAHGKAPSPIHEVAHSCGRGRHGCVNPNHLGWKTRSENQLDRKAHGTATTNKYGRRGKLNEEQRREIRELRGKMTQIKIAALYGVHFETVSRIQRTAAKS